MAYAALVESIVEYRQVLRPVGAYLDLLQARYLLLEEGIGGFVWRCYPHGEREKPEMGTIRFREALELDQTYRETLRIRQGLLGALRRSRPRSDIALPQHPLLPEGYEQLLRSLGASLDGRYLRLVSLEEREDHLTLRHSPLAYADRHGPRAATAFGGQEHEEIYDRAAIRALLGAARRLRGR